MKNVSLQVFGTQYAVVAIPGQPAGSLVNWGSVNIDALQTHVTGEFGGRAMASTGNVAKDIVVARISEWNASLDYILIDKSCAGSIEAKLNREIRVS